MNSINLQAQRQATPPIEFKSINHAQKRSSSSSSFTEKPARLDRVELGISLFKQKTPIMEYGNFSEVWGFEIDRVLPMGEDMLVRNRDTFRIEYGDGTPLEYMPSLRFLEGLPRFAADVVMDIKDINFFPEKIYDMSEGERLTMIDLGLSQLQMIANKYLIGDKATAFMRDMEVLAKYAKDGKVIDKKYSVDERAAMIDFELDKLKEMTYRRSKGEAADAYIRGMEVFVKSAVDERINTRGKMVYKEINWSDFRIIPEGSAPQQLDTQDLMKTMAPEMYERMMENSRGMKNLEEGWRILFEFIDAGGHGEKSRNAYLKIVEEREREKQEWLDSIPTYNSFKKIDTASVKSFTNQAMDFYTSNSMNYAFVKESIEKFNACFNQK